MNKSEIREGDLLICSRRGSSRRPSYWPETNDVVLVLKVFRDHRWVLVLERGKKSWVPPTSLQPHDDPWFYNTD
jgi:hypothetical protein